jgi:hypothetical protein
VIDRRWHRVPLARRFFNRGFRGLARMNPIFLIRVHPSNPRFNPFFVTVGGDVHRARAPTGSGTLDRYSSTVGNTLHTGEKFNGTALNVA